MAQLKGIREDSLKDVMKTKEFSEQSGAGIVSSETGQDAMALREHLEGVKKQGAANIEAARAASTEQVGEKTTETGGEQIMIGQTMMAAAAITAASGLGILVSGGLFVAGAALVATGQGNQAQGEQKIAEAPPIATQAADHKNQSEGHFNKAAEITSEKESEQANNEDSSDPAKETEKDKGKDKGYYVADAGTAGASSDGGGKNELVAERLNAGEEAVNGKFGITTDSDTEKDGIATGGQTTIASQLESRTGEINKLLGVEKEEVA
jgi:hypothetical protein